MSGGPGEAMAHSAFDTILVLDFGVRYPDYINYEISIG